MCGICGIYALKQQSLYDYRPSMEKALTSLSKRGPEVQQAFYHPKIAMGHTRLSIIDTDASANQPFTDETENYTIVFNGEIYNYKELRNQLQAQNFTFRTQSDTEVLLKWLIYKGEKGIEDLMGFFSFAFFDKKTGSLLIARDRFGIKPFYYFLDDTHFVFASELKALTSFPIPKNLDFNSLRMYFHLNYIPAPHSVYKNVAKLMPGHYIQFSSQETTHKQYYKIPEPGIINNAKIPSYEDAQKIFREKLEQSVLRRLVSDVPLGAFLSGGIDSSVIVALAAKHIPGLNTFSIGFKDEPMFDETPYARMVAKMHNTNHTEFLLSTQDLLDCMPYVLDYTDEPFADSSALAVYILSRETRNKVTVALSGDGADEMLAGYNKHYAEWKVRQGGFAAAVVKHIHPALNLLPQSRSSFLGNKVRQLHRFGKGMSLSAAERYWRWAGFDDENYTSQLLLQKDSQDDYQERKEKILKLLTNTSGINEVLYTDMNLVLTNDMLTKVDMMSMANSLEVRVPFLDHDVVNFVFSLPEHYKIDKYHRKKLLKDSFRAFLPEELYTRNKQGFEVPLLKWFKSELKEKIMNHWLSEDFIREQNIFNPKVINNLRSRLFAYSPGEIHAKIWSIIVFQHWWTKYNP